MARPKTLPDKIDKTCPVCENTFSISYYLRNRRTYCSKKCSTNDPSIIDRAAIARDRTYNEKYGGHPMKTEKVRDNLRAALIKKYGVDWYSKSDEWCRRIKETKKKRYGDENYTNRELSKQTCMDKYGVENYKKTEECKKKYTETCLKKYGVEHASQSNARKVHLHNTIFDRFTSHPRFVNFTPLFTIDEYEGIGYKDYVFRCKRCGNERVQNIVNGRTPICPSCDKMNVSFFQKEIYDYILSELGNLVDIQMGDRVIISPKELDIVIPSLKLAIECDGILWHSELFGKKNKIYHLNKTKYAIFKGYRLIHIFDTEWVNKQEIVKSILSSMMKKSRYKIHGRKCEVRVINSKPCCDFLKQNHIQGMDRSSVKLGLFHNDELVSVMTFAKSRFDRKIQWEMSRFCSKLHTHINGGASKLFSYFINTYSPTSIVSYSDRRFFNGNLYLNLGFEFLDNSNPNYFYIIDNYLHYQNRLSWQKHKLGKKLPVFDPLLSEWQNMKNNGFDRIWDCGNSKWAWRVK